MTVLRNSYRVPFKDSPPPLSHTPVSFLTYRAGFPRAQALRQEVEAMLAKGALEIALDPGPGEGIWRPVIDLSHLSEFVLLKGALEIALDPGPPEETGFCTG